MPLLKGVRSFFSFVTQVIVSHFLSYLWDFFQRVMRRVEHRTCWRFERKASSIAVTMSNSLCHDARKLSGCQWAIEAPVLLLK